jgi:hypothetical protein
MIDTIASRHPQQKEILWLSKRHLTQKGIVQP